MTNQLFPTPPRAFDRNGEPLAAAKAYVYLTGTMTAQVVTDVGGTPLAWPVVADINGTFPQMFYAGVDQLKLIITDSADVVQPGYPLDPVSLASATALNASTVVFTPTIQAPSLTVQGGMEDLSTAVGALQAVTITGAGLATGGGALTANRTITVTKATHAQAIARTDNTTGMTPLRTAGAIDARWFVSADQTVTASALLTLPHGLPSTPEIFALSAVCQTGEGGWTAGDVVALGFNNTVITANIFIAVWADATNVYVRLSDYAQCLLAANKTTGAALILTSANWKLRVRAYA